GAEEALKPSATMRCGKRAGRVRPHTHSTFPFPVNSRRAKSRGNSCPLPLRTRDACLSEDHRQKADADVSAMRIRYREHAIGLHHELVLASRVGALESEASQGSDELAAADRSPRGHQPAFLTSILVPPSGGTRSPRATRTRIHSSTTSAS